MFFADSPLGPFLSLVIAALAFSLARMVAAGAGRVPRCAASISGTRVGAYRIRRKLGEGGMGVVYEATGANDGERVAVKLVRGEPSAKRRERFEREIRMLERVRHENLVELRGDGVTPEGARFLAMELLDGADLERILNEQGPLRPARVVSILCQLCDALVAVHAAGIVHRDIKPANVVACEGPGGSSIKLVDFGLATSALDGAHTEDSDEIVGSPHAMAPECFTEPGAVGPAADLYAVGILAYTLLSGAPPFVSGNVVDLAARHLYAEPPSLLERCPRASAELRAAVAACLEKSAELRPASAQALLRALRACPEGRAERRPGARVDRSLASRRAERRRVERAAA